jgi:hypothetical protein
MRLEVDARIRMNPTPDSAVMSEERFYIRLEDDPLHAPEASVPVGRCSSSLWLPSLHTTRCVARVPQS